MVSVLVFGAKEKCMKLEEQLRTLRQEKGLSQAELAELMDVSR